MILNSLCLCNNETLTYTKVKTKLCITWLIVGQFCEKDVDECRLYPNICKNGATCLNHPVGNYTCICVNGWTGRDCSINIDDCKDNPCYNGGTCHDKVGYYYCDCPHGKTGIVSLPAVFMAMIFSMKLL